MSILRSSSYDASEKVSYITNSTNSKKEFELLPATHRVEITDVSLGAAATSGTYKVSVDMESNAQITTTAGTGGALSSTIAAQSTLVPLDKMFTVAGTGITLNGTETIITTSEAVSSSLVGAAIKVNFSDADPLALALPDVLFVKEASGTSIKLGLPKFGGFSASVNASGVVVLNMADISRNVPVSFTNVTVNGNEAKFQGSFPTGVVGSVLVVPSGIDADYIVDNVKGKSEAQNFPITAVDVAAGTITVSDAKGRLKSVAQSDSGKLYSGEIDQIAGISGGLANTNEYYNFGSLQPVNTAGFATGASLKIVQHIRGA